MPITPEPTASVVPDKNAAVTPAFPSQLFSHVSQTVRNAIDSAAIPPVGTSQASISNLHTPAQDNANVGQSPSSLTAECGSDDEDIVEDQVMDGVVQDQIMNGATASTSDVQAMDSTPDVWALDSTDDVPALDGTDDVPALDGTDNYPCFEFSASEWLELEKVDSVIQAMIPCPMLTGKQPAPARKKI